MKKLLVLVMALMMVLPMASVSADAAEDFKLNLCIASEPNSIDPQLNTAVDGAMMLQHAFEGLYKWVDDGAGNATLALGQAADMKVSEDELVYTFTLRDDAKWSDGKAVTAGDFVYTWQRLVDPNTAADYNYMIEMVVNASDIMAGAKQKEELGVKAIDDKTLEITLNTATPYFTEICAFPACFPVRQDIIEANGDQWTFTPDTYIGNGPYKMSEWNHSANITFVPSETYYDVANLGPKELKFTLMDDHNAMYAGFRSGELDFITNVPLDEIPALLESGELKVKPYVGTYFVCFNNQVAPFDNPKVRQAFNLVIDRNYIVEQITRAGQVPASGFVPAGVYDAQGASGDDFRTVGGEYYSIKEEDYQANCDQARALLAEAGFPEGKDFPIVEYVYNTSDSHRAIGEALQEMWQKELGVSVTLVNQEWGVFIDTRKNGDYSIARHGWIADYNDPMTFIDMWITASGNNDAQQRNEQYDALVASAKATSIQADRMKAMHEAEDILLKDDAVIAPIYFYTNPYMQQGFDGMYYTPLGYFMFGYTKPV